MRPPSASPTEQRNWVRTPHFDSCRWLLMLLVVAHCAFIMFHRDNIALSSCWTAVVHMQDRASMDAVSPRFPSCQTALKTACTRRQRCARYCQRDYAAKVTPVMSMAVRVLTVEAKCGSLNMLATGLLHPLPDQARKLKTSNCVDLEPATRLAVQRRARCPRAAAP